MFTKTTYQNASKQKIVNFAVYGANCILESDKDQKGRRTNF